MKKSTIFILFLMSISVRGLSQSLSLSGGSAYLETLHPVFDVLDPGENFTIEFWIKGRNELNTNPNNHHRKGIVTQYDFHGNNRNRFGIETVHGRIAYYKDGSEWLVSNSNVLDDNWHQVLVSRSEIGKINIYVDGELVKSGDDLRPFQNTPLRIGYYHNAPRGSLNWDFQFTGSIDNLIIWDYDMSESEVINRFQNCFISNPSTVLLNFDFNTVQTENRVIDNSDFSNDGNLVGNITISGDDIQECEYLPFWTSLKNVDVIANGIQKNYGSWWDAGARSTFILPANTPGGFVHKIPEFTNQHILFGLSEIDTTSSYEEILFSYSLQQSIEGNRMGLNIFEQQYNYNPELKLSLPTRDVYTGNEIIIERTKEMKILYRYINSSGNQELRTAKDIDGNDIINDKPLIIDSSIKTASGKLQNLILIGNWIYGENN